MGKDAIVPEELAKKFSTEKDTPYLRWVRGEGLDIISAHYVRNLRTVELKPWARRGGRGVYINHEASRTKLGQVLVAGEAVGVEIAELLDALDHVGG